MNRAASTPIAEGVSAISAVFDSIFERVDLWRLAVERHTASRSGDLHRHELDDLIEDIVVPEFAREGSIIIGAGFVAAPGVIADADWHLSWWLGDRNTFGMGLRPPHIRRLEAVEDPAAESFRDYTTLEWWRVPEATGHRHITGPYVDYLCTDEYTLTLTEPVFFGGRSIGVVGADLYAEDLERTLLPALRSLGSPATLINEFGRVLLSTDVHVATGTLLRLDGLTSALFDDQSRATLPSGQRLIRCSGDRLSLLIGG